MEANMKELRCRDAGFDCEAVVQAETVDEVMAQVRRHAEATHEVEVTPEMAGQLSGLVRDV
jgi:predicted small metal-binding protein